MWERNINWLPSIVPLTGEHATAARALSRNRTCYISVCRMMSNQLSLSGWGIYPLILIWEFTKSLDYPPLNKIRDFPEKFVL